jgi:hypothetical protein
MIHMKGRRFFRISQCSMNAGYVSQLGKAVLKLNESLWVRLDGNNMGFRVHCGEFRGRISAIRSRVNDHSSRPAGDQP